MSTDKWCSIGLAVLLLVGVISVAILYNWFGLYERILKRHLIQFSKKHEDFKELEKLEDLYNQQQFDELEKRILSFNWNKAIHMKSIIKGEIARTNHALNWQESVPSYIQFFSIICAFVAIFYNSKNIPPFILTPLLFVALIIFVLIFVVIVSQFRRQIIQDCAGAYEYILNMINDYADKIKDK